MCHRMEDVMKLCCELSANQQIRTTVKGSGKGAAAAGGLAFAGGLVGGPLGIAVGKWSSSSNSYKYIFYHINSLIAKLVTGITVLETLIICRRCCRRPFGMLADQRTVQTTASDHHGAQSSAAAEALWWSHGDPGRHSVDRCSPANYYGDEQRNSEAAAHSCSSRVCHQGVAGRSALFGLVAVENQTQRPQCSGGRSIFKIIGTFNLKPHVIKLHSQYHTHSDIVYRRLGI